MKGVVSVRSARELYNIMIRHSKAVRESLGDSKYIHGEIYADAVFGALLSAVSDNELKREIVDIAFEKYRESDAMCVSLQRENIAADAMNAAMDKGISEAIKIHLGKMPDNELISKYLSEINV